MCRAAMAVAGYTMRSQPVMQAALMSDVAPLSKLRGAVKATSPEMSTALLAAACLGDSSLLVALLGDTKDAEVIPSLDNENQSIEMASIGGHTEAVNTLMQHGAHASDAACLGASLHGQHEVH